MRVFCTVLSILGVCMLGATGAMGADEGEPVKVKVAAIRVLWNKHEETPKEMMARGLRMTEEAAEKGAKYIVLPEDFLQAHKPGDRTVPGPLTDKLVDIAKKHDVYVCSGIQEDEASTKRPGTWDRYITAVFVGPEGVLSKHRKVDVVVRAQSPHYKVGRPKTDRRAFSGHDFEMHKVGAIDRVGVMICRDSFNSWAWTRVLSQDPQIVFHPNMRSSICIYGPNLPEMAKKYGVPIVAPDGHPESESMIVDRDGTMVDYEDAPEKSRVLIGEVVLADEHPEYQTFDVILNQPWK